MRAFSAPARWLAGIDVDATALLIAAAADIAVIVDQQGIVRDFAYQSDSFGLEFHGTELWLGRLWRDQVTIESRSKIDDMVRNLAGPANRAGRQVNYPALRGNDIPVLFTAMPVGQSGLVLAFGRDLRAFAALQQRVADVQQSFERDYAKMRHIETRYRILFQMTPEPVLIIDAAGLKIVEANPAARGILGPKGKVIGATFQDLFETASLAVVESLLADVRAAGRADDVLLRLAGAAADSSATAFLFRQGSAQMILMRLSPSGSPDTRRQISDSKAKLLKLVDSVPDGFVVTNHDGVIIAANEAFLEMAQLRGESQAQGQMLDRWLGRPGVDLGILMTNLRQHGAVRLFSSAMRDEFGTESDVEISAGVLANGGDPCYGFAIRGISRRATLAVAAPARSFPKSLEQIIELIGRVTLKDLVREATDVIERLSIEAALTMTGNNRASAAEILGVSRQSLYVKMRRHGLIDAEALEIE